MSDSLISYSSMKPLRLFLSSSLCNLFLSSSFFLLFSIFILFLQRMIIHAHPLTIGLAHGSSRGTSSLVCVLPLRPLLLSFSPLPPLLLLSFFCLLFLCYFLIMPAELECMYMRKAYHLRHGLMFHKQPSSWCALSPLFILVLPL